MRKFTYLITTLFIVWAVTATHTFAQTAATDSSSQQNALNRSLAFFHSSIGLQSRLYNGIEFTGYDPAIKGNPFFEDVNTFTSGSIYYDGSLYTGVSMMYDIYGDKVVVLLYNHFSKYYLIKEKVKSFSYLDHHFVNIDADTLKDNTTIKSGFFDELYGGKTQVLAKRSKNIQVSPSVITGPESYYNYVQDYYIRKNGTYYSFGSQGAMLSVLKDKKKELQQFIKDNQIKFRQDPEEAMVKIASYYDHLTN
jgi:hypothetical protein